MGINRFLPVSGESGKSAGIPHPVGDAVRSEVTGLDAVAAIFKTDEQKVTVPGERDNKAIVFNNQKQVIFADRHYFELFERDWLAGNPTTALNKPYQVVLAASNAKLYFPKLSAAEIVGKEIYFNDTVRTTITGVVKDLTQHSDFDFKTDYDSYSPGLADKSILYGLMAVAGFLLLLACINFINLTTAQSSQRVKEIGIRKTIGSSGKQLMLQFLSETFLLTLIAAFISALLTPLLLKAFAGFIPPGVTFNIVRQPGVLLFLSGIVVVVSLLSGFYPAVVLSTFKPALVLKSRAYTGNARGVWLRKGLTVTQFVIAQVFIIATLVVGKQINYSQNRNLGFQKDAIVYFGNYTDPSADKKTLLVNKLKAIPGVRMVSLAMDPPSSNSTWIGTMKYNDGKKELQTDVQVKVGDTNYIKLYRLKLLAGTNLPQSDTMNSLLINETYAHALGFNDPRQAIGKVIDCYGKKPVVGVVGDFNQKSLHEVIRPLLITTDMSSERTFNVSLEPQNAAGTAWQNTISRMEKAWKEVYSQNDFNYYFLDESIAAYYTAEQHISTLMKWSSGLTIFIGCLGLLGLVIYITNQRTKEIGVRKVVGASIVQLVTLLSKDFLKLVLLAFVIAIPLAWWGANSWLQGFAYKTTLSWWVFAAGGGIMLLLAFLILGVRTFKAASANPTTCLRTE